MNKLRNRLIKSFKRGELLKAISDEYRIDENLLVKELSNLHNNGDIDILSAFKKLRMKDKRFDFFTIRGIFEECLPLINAPTEDTMVCVGHLIKEAGNDGAAPFTLEAYIEFCKKDVTRAKETIQIIENHPEKWFDFLVPAIIAGVFINPSEYLIITIKYTLHPNSILRQRATFALGRINYTENQQLIDNSYKALKNIIENEKEGDVIANTIDPLFKLLLADSSLEDEIIKLISQSLSNSNQSIIYAASRLFAFHLDKIPTKLLGIIINVIKTVRADEKGIILNIDRGLKHLLQLNFEKDAFILLEYLLINNPKTISIGTFERTSSEIRLNKILLNTIVTRWFLSGNLYLCRATSDIIHLNHDENIKLSVDNSQFDINDIDACKYLSRKAIGWLYTRPLGCVSFIFSILEKINSDIEEITYLLFNPMLISYPGKLTEYLKELKQNCSPKILQVVNDIMQHWELYLDGIKTSDELSELRPSEHQKEIYSRHMSIEMSKALKKSEKESFVYKFFPSSVLLYGNKSIFYTRDSHNKTHRKELPLQEFSHSVESSRLEKLDPHTLDYNLRMFRIEKLKS